MKALCAVVCRDQHLAVCKELLEDGIIRPAVIEQGFIFSGQVGLEHLHGLHALCED